MEAQLGLIAGTMGLLTGFSILSAVEIIYYLLRFKRLGIFELLNLNASVDLNQLMVLLAGSSCPSGSGLASPLQLRTDLRASFDKHIDKHLV